MDAFFRSQNNNLKCISTTKNNQEKKTNVQAFPQYCNIRTSVATTIGAWGSGPAVVLLDINHPLFRTRSGCLPNEWLFFFDRQLCLTYIYGAGNLFCEVWSCIFFHFFLPCILSSNKTKKICIRSFHPNWKPFMFFHFQVFLSGLFHAQKFQRSHLSQALENLTLPW